MTLAEIVRNHVFRAGSIALYQSACLYHCRDLLFANGNSAIPGQGIPLLHPLQITSNGNARAVQVSVIRWQLNCIVWPQMNDRDA